MYYFDYASTTKPSSESLKLYQKLSQDIFLHPEATNNSGKILSEAKSMILASLNLCNDYDVIFTSSGTEANNLAIIGFANNFSSKKHFITSEYEHSSVYNSFKYLQELGHEVTFLQIDSNGQINYKQLEREIREDTVLVSIMSVNNELGSVNDITKIKQIITRSNKQIIFLSDTVQAIGKVAIDYRLLDMLIVSSHKLYAPKGIGALIYKKSINIKPIMHGGVQQGGIRPGTNCQNLSTVLAVAIKREITASIDNKVEELIGKFISYITSTPKLELNCQTESNIVSVNFKTKALSETILKLLLNNDIYASSRSACSKKLNVRSRSLQSIGLTNEQIDRTIRFSFSRYTTSLEVDYLIKQITKIINNY